jgi:hypothetical protein
VNLPTALAFGRGINARLPADHDIRLIGIEAADVTTIGDQCTPAVEAAIPLAVKVAVQTLDSMLGSVTDPRRLSAGKPVDDPPAGQ